MIDDNGVIYVYTNRTRIMETKRLKYQKLTENHKVGDNIKEIENQLGMEELNSKTVNYEKFKKYVSIKTQANDLLLSKYEKEFYRKLKWYSYINTKRSEDNLLNRIEEIYNNENGEKPIIMIGDCGDNPLSHYISCPNKKLLNKLSERFEVYLVDEYRTSKLNNITECEQENLYLPDFYGKTRKIHSILTYEMENKRQGCINRDKNAVYNIKKLVKCYLTNTEIPVNYRRTTKILEKQKIKDLNLQQNASKLDVKLNQAHQKDEKWSSKRVQLKESKNG